MNILVPVGVAAIVLGIALRIYPRWIARVFREDDANAVPSETFADGRDFVKSRSHVVFGHHFATIAGAGPIVGPILALAFGWQPVWLWVVLGGIFFGAVHDMTAMFVSVREGGRSVARIAKDTLGPVGYLLNLIVLIFVITIVNAIFLNLSVTALTSAYPLSALGLDAGQRLLGTFEQGGVTMGRIGGIATTSVFAITAFAPLLGWLIRRRRLPTLVAYGLAGVVCVASIVLGFLWPITLGGDTWRLVMTGYVFVACTVPVWMILQPRDFTNVQLLYGGMALLFFSVLGGGNFPWREHSSAAARSRDRRAGAPWNDLADPFHHGGVWSDQRVSQPGGERDDGETTAARKRCPADRLRRDDPGKLSRDSRARGGGVDDAAGGISADRLSGRRAF